MELLIFNCFLIYKVVDNRVIGVLNGLFEVFEGIGGGVRREVFRWLSI